MSFMDGYERILVPTDMSDFAGQAIRYAAFLRETLGSRITLLFADETYFPADVLEIPLGFYLEEAPETKVRLRQKLVEHANLFVPGTDVETTIVQDSPVRAIVRTAREMDASLVVMGTHGRRGWRRALLGSVASSVLHEIARPVLTVTPDIVRGTAEPRIRNIVCPVNFTFIARDSLAHASRLARAFGAELHVIYVAEGLQPPQLREVESAFSLWVDPGIRGQAHFRLSVVDDGDAAERVLTVARDVEADLLVIGAQHRFFSDATTIGTTTQRITNFARCPVLTVARKARTEIDVVIEQEELAGV